ncbi:MAG TPA: hypothetical protein VG605_23520 [Puia sp.]|nr:hypothetical protein [Puia sp.]
MFKYLTAIGVLLWVQASAQLPEDALRNSWTTPSGTAREQAIGGAMGSIGGDITAGFVNPAGIGVYKTSEFVVSPGWQLFNGYRSTYLGTGRNAPSLNKFAMGASGIVIALPSYNPGVSNALSIAVNRTADFNGHVAYQGINANSSFAEQYAEEFAYSGLDIDNGIASPTLDYGTRMALYSYLIDTATVNGSLQVIAQPQKSGRVLQQNDLRTSGGITELNISLATDQHNKWYLGASVGIPIISYTRYQTYTETDVSGNTNNDFESFTYRETYRTTGAGLNARFGAIFSPSRPWRIGLAITTPSALALQDRISASLDSRTENYTPSKDIHITSDSLDQLTNTYPQPNYASYNLYTPWHFLLSASYLFGGGQADVKNQKGFVTADLEYMTTHDPHFSSNNDENGGGDIYDPVNAAIKENYKGTFGARLGGEMKFDTWFLRAGGAYYSNPYSQSGQKADKLYLSAGLGYRVRAFFVDLAYVMGFTHNTDFPYRLADKDNYAASLKQTSGTALLTFGIKW